MAVKIRLKRMGAKKKPFYRIVVADSRSPRDGRFIEEIGYYNPLTSPKEIKVNRDKAVEWIKNGAKPTDTVHHLFKMADVYAGSEKKEKPVEEPKKEEPVEEPKEDSEKVETEK